jgi:hypothetical protein
MRISTIGVAARLAALTLTSLLAFGLGAGAAEAQGLSHHSHLSVHPITRQGQVVGFKLKGALHSAGFDVARVGLGRSSVREAIRTSGWDPGKMRGLLERQDASYIRAQFSEHTALPNGGVKEFEHEVLYGQGNDLAAGEEVDVWTAWRRASDGRPMHFFGVFQGGGHVFTSLKLPGQ